MYTIDYMAEDIETEKWTLMWVDDYGYEQKCRQHFFNLNPDAIAFGRGYFLRDHNGKVVAKLVHSRKQYKVNFCAGESIVDNSSVDYMMLTEPIPDSDDMEWHEAHLYCEIEVFEDDMEDDENEKPSAEAQHWKELKKQLIAKAKKYGIYEDQLVF